MAVTGVVTTSPAAADLLKGPHLQDLRTDGVTIVWQQQNPGAGTVTIAGTDYPSPSTGVLQEVAIAGLTPETLYDYTLQTDGVTRAGSFTTAPSVPLSPIRFVVIGDNRTDPVAHESVVDAVLAEGPVDFVLNTGDMVASGEVEADWQQFFDVEQPLIQSTPWFSVVGNHEEDGGDLPHFYTDYLAPPTTTSGVEAYYSFTFSNAAFVVLDGHVHAEDVLFGLWRNFDAAQRAWLDTVLTQYDADPSVQHIFVLNHEPPYSSSPGRTGMHALRLLLPLFESRGVDAILNGHDHYLERGESPEGIPYFIIGGGGAPLYDNSAEGNLGFKPAIALPWLDDAHTVHFARKDHGYLVVDVCNGQVDTVVKDTSGSVLDAFSWNTGDLPPGGCDGAGGAGAGGGGTGGTATGGTGAGATGTGGAAAGNAGGSAATTDPGLSDRPQDGEADAGCGCKLVASRGAPSHADAPWLGAALALALARRRRNASRTR